MLICKCTNHDVTQLAFQQLMEYIHADIIDIEVLPWNERGYLFWKSCGFKDTCISMRHKK